MVVSPFLKRLVNPALANSGFFRRQGIMAPEFEAHILGFH